jgi:EmrB/QacA subfamily drug resistance transporter
MSLSIAMPAEARVAQVTRTMWLILIAVVMADALDLMDATLTMIAAPTIAANLGGGELLIKWLGSAYALALGSLLVIGGRLGDRFGQRRTFLIGIAGFTLASALCGLSPNSAVLIAGRLLQGGFGALLIPQGVAVLTSTFPRETLGKAFSAFGPTLAVASVTGPLLGAFIVTANFGGLSWRPMFLINVIIGSIGFVLAWKVMPRTPGDRSVVLDGLGSGLLSASMLMLIYGLIEGSTSGWAPITLASMVGGLVCLAVFAVRQAVAANPLIKPSLFANRGFTAGLVVALGFFSIVSGLGYVLSLFMQQGMGLTAVEAAVAGIAPMSIGIMIASFAAAPLIVRLGRRLVLFGLVLTLAGVAGLWAVTAVQGTSVGAWSLTVPVFVIGLGMGCGFGSLFSIALGDIDHAEAGSASGSLSAVQQLAAAIGSAAITSIWFGAMGSDVTSAMAKCLAVVAVVLVGCMALVGLLPRQASEEAH